MSDTEFEDTDPPRDVSIEKSKRKLYEELQESEDSPFKGVELNEIFLFALAYGTRKAGKTPLSGDRHALFNRSSINDNKQWVIRSIAVREKRTTEVLQDGKQVYQIAMEYANGGIDELHGKVFGPADALIELSDEIMDMANDIEKVDNPSN